MQRNLLGKILVLQLCLWLTSTITFAKDYLITSPDKNIQVKVSVTDVIKWSVARKGEAVLLPSPLSMTLVSGEKLGVNPVVQKDVRRSVKETITAVVPVKNRSIPDVYNELKLQCKGGYVVHFRAYNEGAAYRFETNFPGKEIEVQQETADFQMGGNYQVYWPQETDPEFQSHYEATFKDTTLASIRNQQYGYLPLLFTSGKGTKVLLTETDLYDYPNLFLFGSGSSQLTSAFPKVILESKLKGNSDRNEQITRKAGYIARTSGKRTFPWRTLIVTDDKGLLETELVYKLASPNVLQQIAWIKPGKVAWDWYNFNNVYGVDFRAGVNTNTYKYYIDFAAQYGLEYIILDEGWSAATTNLMAPNKDLDLEALMQYANSKNVGVILWALWNTLDKDIDGILDQFVKWGVKGVKVDFMARGDQYMVNYYERVAKAAAQRHLLVDLHGAYKPVGLNRKYPNVLSYEGVKGLENNKWSDIITPTHNVTLPFTRMVSGPMDFTPGAMVNSTKAGFKDVFNQPMSQGTRAHQVAMYVIYESPLQMLADSPTNYLKDPECTRFISQIPTTWDKTVALAGESGKYVAMARQHGKNWYIGGMTNWDARDLSLPLTFLDGKTYRMEILRDGINADRHPQDYKIESRNVKAGDIVPVKMSGGGGWAAILKPVE
ncbi:glycoside hydrolase family 97 protein [Rufibacter hautae]|uniref:Glycoside hydrolase family 97 protein n=1 Tax=Rufibacter hautae TaxID=2595005 RepID=A0A5B6TET6_9BACT|nr:glycoside hydrolase family 97 protein [Rufibacter hautae]KAA3438676.1 glycoside hydrolase family 97 protein [Rufibacter hautae]